MPQQLLKLAAGLALSLLTAPALAVDSGGHDWLRFVAALNRPTLAEPAGEHGTIGTTMGVGELQVETPEPAADVAARELNQAPGAGAAQRLPTAWIVKGTPWPVDVGVSVGAAADASFTVAAAHAQVTVLEGLALPAVSLRGGYSRVFGLAGTNMATAAGDVVASYGFLRYFTAYGALGAERSVGDYGGEAESWTEARRAVGLKVMVVPPFVSLTGEASLGGGKAQGVVAKVGVGI